MGGCVCKMDGQNQSVSSDNSKPSQNKSEAGFTINNNYNNNTISIIDGNTITTQSGTSQQSVTAK